MEWKYNKPFAAVWFGFVYLVKPGLTVFACKHRCHAGQTVRCQKFLQSDPRDKSRPRVKKKWTNKPKKQRKNAFYLIFFFVLVGCKPQVEIKQSCQRLLTEAPRQPQISTNMSNSNGQKEISECKALEMFWLLFLCFLQSKFQSSPNRFVAVIFKLHVSSFVVFLIETTSSCILKEWR